MKVAVKPCFVCLKNVGAEKTVTLPKVKLAKEQKQHLLPTKKSMKPATNVSKIGKKSAGKCQMKISAFFSPSFIKKEIKKEKLKKTDIKVGEEEGDSASTNSGIRSRSVTPPDTMETNRTNTPDEAAEEEVKDMDEGLEADVLIRKANGLDLTKLETELLSSTSIPEEFKKQSKNLLTEYRRFLALKVIFGDTSPPLKLSPSAIVDSVWHLHLLMPAHYVKCCKQLGEEVIDHNSSGARDHKIVRMKRLEMTKRSYKVAFGVAPPDRFWDLTYQLFTERESISQNGPRDESHHVENKTTHVNIKVLGWADAERCFNMKRTSKMVNLYISIQKWLTIDEGSFRLAYDGIRIRPNDTPDTFRMVDGDVIEMFVIPRGC